MVLRGVSPAIRRAAKALIYKDENVWVDLFATRLYANRRQERRYVMASRLQAKSRALRHELQLVVHVCALVEERTTFLDCGANIGLWTASIARLGSIYADLKVVAFEANPSTYQRLLALKEHFDNIEMHNVALSDSRRMIELEQGIGSGDFGVRRPGRPARGRALAMDARPLDEFAAKYDNMVVKIDVEGHELEVLSGMRSMLADRRVKAILLDDFERSNEDKIIALLENAGFRLINGNTLEPFVRGDYALLALALPEGHAAAAGFASRGVPHKALADHVA
jgi:FkbM family methyltransferase